MIGFFAKIFVALNSNSRPGELASGLAFGFWLALLPGGNLLWAVLFILAFFIKHNTGAFLVSLALFRLVTPLSDPLLDRLGRAVLEQPALQDVFTRIYNLPLLPYSSFNNSLVMGGFLLGLLLWVPLFFLFRLLVRVYRTRLAPKIAESRLVRGLKAVPLFSKFLRAVEKLTAYV